jgi:hypothetical protein
MTSSVRLLRLLGRPAIVAVGAAAILTAAAGAALAARDYGPPPPGPSVPGGFSVVVTSQTVGPEGGTIGPVAAGRLHVTLRVPAGAFPVRVQITVTSPNVSAIGDAGYVGFRAVAGVGIRVQEHGATYPGTFLKPLTMTVSSGLITESSVVVVWNGSAFVIDHAAVTRAGSGTVTFDSDPDFAVLAPTSAAIPGATTAPTGKPFLGEAIVAAALLLLGTSGLAYARRSRAGT